MKTDEIFEAKDANETDEPMEAVGAGEPIEIQKAEGLGEPAETMERMRNNSFICSKCTFAKLTKDGRYAYCKKLDRGVTGINSCTYYSPYKEREICKLPVSKYPNLALFTFNGCGLSFFGRFRKAGFEYDTIRWVTFVFIPIVPIDSYRVYNLGTSDSSFFIKEFIVIDKIPMKLCDVLRIYLFVYGTFALIYLLSLTLPYFFASSRLSGI